MDLRVDHECGEIERPTAFDDRALVIDEEQILDPDLSEIHSKGIDPEVVEKFRVAGCDVAGRPFAEAELPEETKGCCQSLFAMAPFLLDGLEFGEDVWGAIGRHLSSV